MRLRCIKSAQVTFAFKSYPYIKLIFIFHVKKPMTPMPMDPFPKTIQLPIF